MAHQPQQPQQQFSTQHDLGRRNGRKHQLRNQQTHTHGLWLLACPCTRAAHFQGSSAFPTHSTTDVLLLLQVAAEAEAGLASWAGNGGPVAAASLAILPDCRMLASYAYAGTDLQQMFKVSPRCSQDPHQTAEIPCPACVKRTACLANPPRCFLSPCACVVLLQALHAHGDKQAIEALGKKTLAAMLLQLAEIHAQVCRHCCGTGTVLTHPQSLGWLAGSATCLPPAAAAQALLAVHDAPVLTWQRCLHEPLTDVNLSTAHTSCCCVLPAVTGLGAPGPQDS